MNDNDEIERLAVELVREVLITPRQRLERFVQRYLDGEQQTPADMALVAKGVSAGLATGDLTLWESPKKERRSRGRPRGSIHSEREWGAAAVIQFYRRLLPEFFGIDPTPQESFVSLINRDIRAVRRMEGWHPRQNLKDENSWAFAAMICYLLEKDGLQDRVCYCRVTNKLREPMVRVGAAQK